MARLQICFVNISPLCKPTEQFGKGTSQSTKRVTKLVVTHVSSDIAE